MTNNDEKIKEFGDMVEATEKMSAPWRETVFKMIKAMIFTNLFWAVVLGVFIWFAYMAPDTTYQTQEFDGHQQVQSSGTEVVTNGMQ